jgi:hypothetical protein
MTLRGDGYFESQSSHSEENYRQYNQMFIAISAVGPDLAVTRCRANLLCHTGSIADRKYALWRGA